MFQVWPMFQQTLLHVHKHVAQDNLDEMDESREWSNSLWRSMVPPGDQTTSPGAWTDEPVDPLRVNQETVKQIPLLRRGQKATTEITQVKSKTNNSLRRVATGPRKTLNCSPEEWSRGDRRQNTLVRRRRRGRTFNDTYFHQNDNAMIALEIEDVNNNTCFFFFCKFDW